jgi:hypothetical protein
MPASSLSDRIQELVERGFAGLADPVVKLSTVIRTAIRVARLRGDVDNLWWLEKQMRPLGTGTRDQIASEFAGHYTTDELTARHNQISEVFITERTAEFPVSEGSARQEERVFGGTIPELEEKIETLRRMPDEFKPPEGLAPADLWTATERHQDICTYAVSMLGGCQTVLSRVEHRVHTFLSETEKQLVHGQVNADISERNREYVDAQLGAVSPEALDQITAAYRRAQEDDEEARSHALTSCRRAMKSLADAIYPPTDEPAVGEDGAAHELTDDKWRNRLIQFTKETLAKQVAGDVLTTQLTDLDQRLRALNAAADRGVHANVTAFELNQAVMQTYLTIGDLLRIHAGESGLTAAPIAEPAGEPAG